MSTRFLQILLLLLLFAVSAVAADWHGITPLHSTRTDVERLLGKPNAENDRYGIGNEVAEIYYSKGVCANGWRVPIGTVILIAVHFQDSQRLSDLKINLSRFERVPNPVTPSHVYYVNINEGLRYEVFESQESKGPILTVYYESTAEDERLLYCRESTPKVRNPCATDVCPSIFVLCGGDCRGPEYPLTASYVVSCPERQPTFKWKLSNGRITRGRGTETITIKPRKKGRPLTATVRI